AGTSRQAAGKRNGACVVWDLTTRQRLAEFDLPATSAATAPAAVFSNEGSRLLVATTRQGDRPVLVFAGFDVKAAKKLAEVEDPTAAGNIFWAVGDDTWAEAASSAGRVWLVDYATGQIGEDIDNLPARGESPLTGPIAFSPDGKRFAIGVVGEQYTTYGVRVYDWPT